WGQCVCRNLIRFRLAISCQSAAKSCRSGECNVNLAANDPTLPTVTGFAARKLLEVLHERNVALAPLLRRADLADHDLTDPQHRISAAAQSRLLEVASETLNDDALGFHLATKANPRQVGLLFY